MKNCHGFLEDEFVGPSNGFGMTYGVSDLESEEKYCYFD